MVQNRLYIRNVTGGLIGEAVRFLHSAIRLLAGLRRRDFSYATALIQLERIQIIWIVNISCAHGSVAGAKGTPKPRVKHRPGFGQRCIVCSLGERCIGVRCIGERCIGALAER
jgi:hypothetical protein